MKKTTSVFPYISVVIPTYNRQKQLKSCLQALAKQTYEGDWEVIVVDDGSSVDLKVVTDLFKKQLRLSLLVQKNRGPAAARNNGVKHAQGDYIAFLDDDCIPRKDWLAQLAKHAQPGMMIGGLTVNQLTANPYSETSQLMVSFLYDHLVHTSRHFFTSNNFLVPRQDFLRIGGFDETFPTSAGEDREFCMRWLAKGFQMKYCREVIIDHAHYLNLSFFWKQHFKYGTAIPKYQKKMADHGVTDQPFRLSFYFRLIAYPFRKDVYQLLEKLKISALLFISQLATVCGVLLSKKNQ